jgi:outer membrane protein assembly factor BamB
MVRLSLYVNTWPPMYRTLGESGLSSPAVVNDIVFCSTSKIAVYAFDTYSGKMLWEDQFGEQTGGFNGGYEDIVWARPLQATLWLRVRWFREARRRA